VEEGVPLLRRGPWVRVPGGSPRPTKDRHVKTGLVLAGRWFMSGAHPVNGYTLRVYLWSIDRWRKPVCDSRNSSTRRWGKNTRGGAGTANRWIRDCIEKLNGSATRETRGNNDHCSSKRWRRVGEASIHSVDELGHGVVS